MKISVRPGDVRIASIEVLRHTGGIYTVRITTPHHEKPGLVFGISARSGEPLAQDVFLCASDSDHFTRVTLVPESNDEEEALIEGLFDVLDQFSRYAVTLIAIPAAVLEEAEEAGTWEPQGNVDYLTS